MKRLVELPGDDRLTARAQALVDAMGRTPESEERLLRVRRSLDAPVRAGAPRWVWRGALAFGLVGVSAVAAASGAGWWGAPSARQIPAESRSKAAAPSQPERAHSPAGAAAPVNPPDMPNPTGNSVVASASPRAVVPRVATPPLSDVARVHEAAKALRHDADPERALQLLERPGARISGPLAEEALALRIEASAARGDGHQAKLAAAYLAQYPNGRYKELAHEGAGRSEIVTSRGRRVLVVLVLITLAGCARDVAVGHEDALAAAGGDGTSGNLSPGAAGSAMGGAVNGGAPNGGDSSGGELGDLLWSADHETASFDEWLGDGDGIQYEQRTGQLTVTTERAHSGTHALTASITADDGELQQAMMGRNLTLLDGRYGAWYLLPEAPRADYWVIMKLSNGSATDRFDLDIEARAGAEAHLRLFEHPNMWLTEPASVAFPIGRWVHVEVLYRSTPNNDGRLVVLQDGAVVFDIGPRATASDDRVTFYCGSASRSVTPSPFRLFIDDVTIHGE